MELIKLMPNLFGEQLYPLGQPMPSNKIKIEGTSVQNIFLRYSKRPTPKDEEILRQYVLYFFLAPPFKIPDEEKEKAKKLSFKNLLELSLYYEIDPFQAAESVPI